MNHNSGETELHYFLFVVLRSEGSVPHTEYDLCTENCSFLLKDIVANIDISCFVFAPEYLYYFELIQFVDLFKL